MKIHEKLFAFLFPIFCLILFFKLGCSTANKIFELLILVAALWVAVFSYISQAIAARHFADLTKVISDFFLDRVKNIYKIKKLEERIEKDKKSIVFLFWLTVIPPLCAIFIKTFPESLCKG